MHQYRKKPIVIEAIQLEYHNIDEVVEFIGKTVMDSNAHNCTIAIDTLEGLMQARENDYIIKGISGEFYPCKPEIFEDSYEKIEEQQDV